MLLKIRKNLIESFNEFQIDALKCDKLHEEINKSASNKKDLEDVRVYLEQFKIMYGKYGIYRELEKIINKLMG